MYVAFILRCVVVGEGFVYGLIVFLGFFLEKKKLFLAISESFRT